MKSKRRTLILTQINKRFSKWENLKTLEIPSEGWIHSIRVAIGMNLRQLGKRLGITPQSAKELEKREKSGSLTLRGLQEVANALNLKLVYILLPNQKTLKEIIEERSLVLAQEIVLRTSQSMKLENQKVSKERIQVAIKEKAEEIQKEMPSYLWD
ncbi:MAG: mobile mystery protein A [Leptospiraceae bacterium]|nr:mobile mystery protein A [Leptospiraceae bacterium]MBK7053997.1 mobile mystery protein A [Leptospiraceae bacterium]MBK9499880.1 mobile mystery protein A [Leptospiraceae bacterium]MBL0262546.1 mobile mystery protein A [Leptospiraceae bacterium]MBP9163739.1 mobile mystery protein A [Leptospiraceae bacterium]